MSAVSIWVQVQVSFAKYTRGRVLAQRGCIFGKLQYIQVFTGLAFFLACLLVFCHRFALVHYTEHKTKIGNASTLLLTFSQFDHLTDELMPWDYWWFNILGMVLVPCTRKQRAYIVEMVNTDQGVYVREGTEPVHHPHSYCTNPIPSWLTGLINYQLCWGNHKMENIIVHKNQSGGRLALGVNEALLWGSCVIGVSLSEPHTSKTTLHSCVAILVCLWPMHDCCQSAVLATRSKAYWSRSNFRFVHLWTINGRLLTGSTKRQSQMPEIQLIISL